MGLLGSALLGGAAAAGGYTADVAEKNIQSLIAEDRMKRLEEHRVATQEAATVRGEQRKIENDRTVRKEILDETIANAPKLREIKTADQRALNEENLRAEVSKFEKMAPLKRADAIATATETLKAQATPEMLAAARKIAMAKHIVDPSYSLTQDADGTIRTFDARSGKVGEALKDPATGQPIVRRSDEQVRAAREVILATGAEIRSADSVLATANAHYKAQKPNEQTTDPAVKKKADEEWAAAQKAYQIRVEAARAERSLAVAALSTKVTGAKKSDGPEQLGGPTDGGGLAETARPAGQNAAPSRRFRLTADGKIEQVTK